MSLLLVAMRSVSGVMSFRLSSDTAGSGFPESQAETSIMSPDGKLPRDTPCDSRDKWQNKNTHVVI